MEKIINDLKLKEKEKKQILELINFNKVKNIDFIHNKIYLYLENKKIIILSNASEATYYKLQEKIIHFNKKNIKTRNNIVWTTEEIAYLKKI